MKPLMLCATLLAFFELSIAHDEDHNTGYQEPFVGWTKEDLDAKWGTDVSSMKP